MFRVLFVLVLLGLAACQPAVDAPLPTLADPGAPADTVTLAPSATPSLEGVRPTLPPTWTPPPPPTSAPVDAAALPSPTPIGFRTSGTLYYIFNDQAIVELAPDGSFEDLLPIPHIGQRITDLIVAPDDSRLAYVAPGSGSAREIYITNRQGTETQQVSRLGFARITDLAWRPGTNEIAFLASQSPDTPMDIYIIAADGSSQRRLLPWGSNTIRDLAWDGRGQYLYFSDEQLYAVDAAVGIVTPPLTATTGFGPDTSPTHSLTAPLLYYLKPFKNFDTGAIGGRVAFIDTSDLSAPPEEILGAELFATGITFSRDGMFLLIHSEDAVWVQGQIANTAFQVHRDGRTAPTPALSPDANRVAYVDLDADGIAQVYITTRLGENPTQITNHQEGQISNMLWAAG